MLLLFAVVFLSNFAEGFVRVYKPHNNSGVVYFVSQDDFNWSINNTEDVYSTYTSVPLYFGQDNFTDSVLSGVMIYYTDAEKLNELTGFIIMVDTSTNIYENYLKNYQSKGALAVVTGSPLIRKAGGIMYNIASHTWNEITIPSLQMEKNDYAALRILIMKYGSLNVTLTFSEINPWQEANEGWFMLFWTYVVGIPAFALMIESGRRLVLIIFRGAEGRQKVPAYICLSFEFLSNFFTIIMCIDPCRSNRIYLFGTANSFLILPFFLGLIPTIMLAFYLHEIIISKKVHISTFLDKLRIPLIIVVITIFIFGTVSLIIIGENSFGSGLTLSNILIAVIYLVDLSLGIYFAIIGHQLINAMRKTAKFSRQLRRSTIKLVVIVGGILAEGICAVFLAIQLPYSPYEFNTIYLIFFILSLMVSGAIIITFETGSGNSSSNRSSTSNKSTHTETGSKALDQSESKK